ncbi:hypothetical protein K461DRAFT_275155 [Myriangium duriaei CBS 260.36]|uniref:U1-type domain-containing protein n=1 Tax=Myriangium duriaei CBS 260.36 TaxID=1168546 RepID=A0A9P4JBZ9_9PEZI|nr:hypothetical protein K461DRAFT_275155 [Myriangium duriaei CBS 260.36]
MSEYWKSTPKYWCKFCKIYIRDTNLEKKQHEATGKHQNAIQKSLRELHKTQGREERDKQRAKDEVARLNGLVSGKAASQAGPSTAGPPSVAKAKPHFTRPTPVKATAEDRKRQAEQLAAMGIAVPDEFRKDLSIAGEWSTVSTTPVYSRPPPTLKDEDEDEDEDSKDFLSSIQHKKRKLDDEDENEDGLGEESKGSKRIWGSSTKVYPGSSGGDADDFDALLAAKPIKEEIKAEAEELKDGVKLKKEESAEEASSSLSRPELEAGAAIVDAPVVFKKRKGKR